MQGRLVRRCQRRCAGGAVYLLYWSACGGFCSTTLLLRKEIELLGVLKLVSSEWATHQIRRAELRMSSDGKVQVVRDGQVLHTVGEGS